MAKTDALLDDIKAETITHISDNYNYFGFGDSALPASSTQTALGNEITRIARQTTTNTANGIIISGYLNSTEGNGSTFQELGSFDTTTAGANEMQERIVFATPYIKTSDKELWIDINTDVEVNEE